MKFRVQRLINGAWHDVAQAGTYVQLMEFYLRETELGQLPKGSVRMVEVWMEG